MTRAINRLGERGIVGLRGPFGRGWPLRSWRGETLFSWPGESAWRSLRPVVYWLLRNRARFRRVILLYGCRTPEDRLYREELDKWSEEAAIDALVTVDNATAGWVGPVGVVTKLLQRIKVNAERTTVFVCGPRMLNRAAAWSFLQLHVPPERVF